MCRQWVQRIFFDPCMRFGEPMTSTHWHPMRFLDHPLLSDGMCTWPSYGNGSMVSQTFPPAPRGSRAHARLWQASGCMAASTAMNTPGSTYGQLDQAGRCAYLASRLKAINAEEANLKLAKQVAARPPRASPPSPPGLPQDQKSSHMPEAVRST